MFRDIAAMISEKSLNPENNRPYAVSIILNAMKQIHYSVSKNKSAKQQASDVIKLLKKIMPITRIHMLIRIIIAPVCKSHLCSTSVHTEYMC